MNQVLTPSAISGVLSSLAASLSTALEPSEIITLFFQACQSLLDQPYILNITNPRYQNQSAAENQFPEWSHSFPVGNNRFLLGTLIYPDALDSLQKESLEIAASMVLSCLEACELRIRNQELTERISYEQQKNCILRSVAHDLRTPLTGIMGIAELISMNGSKDNIRKMGKEIFSQADWLHDLLENLLSLTRLESRGLALEKHPQIVQELLEESIRRIPLERRNRPILFKSSPDLILTDADPRLVIQALVNLLDNALLHSGPNSPVEISLDSDGNDAVIEIGDYGSGIAPENMDHIFDAFFTTRAAETGHRKGTGLGLPIARAVVQAHGGNLSVRNRSNGTGAIFTVRLPLSSFHAS